MALNIVMRKSKAGDDGMAVDTYYGNDGSWSFEIHVPRGTEPTIADVHFEFEDDEETQS